jgi:hypothetical protein
MKRKREEEKTESNKKIKKILKNNFLTTLPPNDSNVEFITITNDKGDRFYTTFEDDTEYLVI